MSDSILELLRPHVARIFEAGKRAALVSRNGHGHLPEHLPEVDEIEPFTLDDPDPDAEEQEAADREHHARIAPHLPAMLGAMLDHAIHAAEHDEWMGAGLDAIVGLLDAPKRLRKVAKGLFRSRAPYEPGVVKGLRDAGALVTKRVRQPGEVWQGARGWYFKRIDVGGRLRTVRTKPPGEGDEGLSLAAKADKEHADLHETRAKALRAVQTIRKKASSLEPLTAEDLRDLAGHLEHLSLPELATTRDLLAQSHPDLGGALRGKRKAGDVRSAFATYARSKAEGFAKPHEEPDATSVVPEPEAATATPTTEREPEPEPEPEEEAKLTGPAGGLADLPASVQSSLKRSIGRLHEFADSLERARALDKKLGTGGRHEAEVHAKGGHESAHDAVHDFREAASKYGVNADWAIQEAGGVPDTSLSPAGRAYRDNPQPPPRPASAPSRGKKPSAPKTEAEALAAMNAATPDTPEYDRAVDAYTALKAAAKPTKPAKAAPKQVEPEGEVDDDADDKEYLASLTDEDKKREFVGAMKWAKKSPSEASLKMPSKPIPFGLTQDEQADILVQRQEAGEHLHHPDDHKPTKVDTDAAAAAFQANKGVKKPVAKVASKVVAPEPAKVQPVEPEAVDEDSVVARQRAAAKVAAQAYQKRVAEKVGVRDVGDDEDTKLNLDAERAKLADRMAKRQARLAGMSAPVKEMAERAGVDPVDVPEDLERALDKDPEFREQLAVAAKPADEPPARDHESEIAKLPLTGAGRAVVEHGLASAETTAEKDAVVDAALKQVGKAPRKKAVRKPKVVPPEPVSREAEPTQLASAKRVTGHPGVDAALHELASAPEGSVARRALDAALGNLDVDADAPPRKYTGTERDVAGALVSAWLEVHRMTGGDSAQLAPLERALAATGVRPVGSVGEEVPFDGKFHEHPAGVSTGTPVRVVRPGWVLPGNDGRTYRLVSAATEPVSREAELPQLPLARDHEPGSLGAKLADEVGQLDQAQVNHLRNSRQQTEDAMQKGIDGAKDELERLKGQLHKVGTMRPEKRNLTKQIKELEALEQKRSDDLYRYRQDDTHYRNRLEHAALNEDHPEFVRYAAARAAKKADGDETYAHIKDSVRDYLAANGHNPEVASAVAAEVARNPLRGVHDLDNVISGETVRHRNQQERKAAREHLASLALPQHLQEQAEEEAGRLYAGDLDQFRSQWTKKAESHAAEQVKKAEGERIAAERNEQERVAKGKAEEYIRATRNLHPPTDTDAATMAEVVRRVADAPAKWHAGYELPRIGSAKQVTSSMSGDDGGRFALPKTITEQGYITDTKYLMKATPEMVAAAKEKEFDKREGNTPPLKSIIAGVKSTEPARIVAGKHPNGVDSSSHKVLVESESGRQAEFDADYIATIKKFYPKAELKLDVTGETPHGIFEQDGEVVGFVMPFNRDDGPKQEYATESPLSLRDVAEPGAYKPEDIGAVGNELVAGKGANEMRLRIGGNSKSGYTIPSVTSREFTTWAQASAFGKEVLSHAHGVDEQGNLIFKPRGAAGAEVHPEESKRLAFYANLRKRAKAAMGGKPVSMDFGTEEKPVKRDVIPVGEHIGVMKELPDYNGKEGSGHQLVHMPTGMTIPDATWKAKEYATQHALLLDGIPGIGWGTVGNDLKAKDPERSKEIGRRVRAVTEAFQKDELHPDMG